MIYTKTRTEVKKSNVKILQNTKSLFKMLYYLTKLSLKNGEGTKIYIDVSHLARLLELNERTIRNHIIILRKLGMIHRIYENRHFYELREDVLADLIQKKRPKSLRVYLKVADNYMDNLLFFPSIMEKKATTHNIYDQDKSNKSQGEFLKNKEEGEVRPKRTTVQDMRAAAEEIFGRNFNLDQRLCRFLVRAMELKFKTLERFREYCETIKKSWIYFSSRIRSLIHYILKFSVIDAFMSKEEHCYVVGDYVESCDTESTASKAFKCAYEHIENVPEDEGCKYIRRLILQRYGSAIYNAWMTEVILEKDIYEKVLIKESPSQFVSDYIEQNLLTCLR